MNNSVNIIQSLGILSPPENGIGTQKTMNAFRVVIEHPKSSIENMSIWLDA